MAFVLILGCMGNSTAFAAESSLDEDSLKEKVLLVKNKFEIGDEYTEFEYDYYESSTGNVWQFFWSDVENNRYISVTCDDNGHIRNYYADDYSGNYGIPQNTKAETEGKALAWIKQIEPEIADKLVLKSCSYTGYQNSYRYVFSRCENGITMPDNYVSISIRTDGSKVNSFSEAWNYTVKIPSAGGTMEKKAAAAIVKENVKMELQYLIGWDEQGNEKIFLAYQPDRKYIAVNAKTGRVYLKKNYWNDDEEFYSADETMSDSAVNGAKEAGGASLSAAELAKADEVKGLITSEEAIELIKSNESLYVDENLNDVTARLYCRDGIYYWQLNMSDIRPIDWESRDIYRAYLSASVNAKTGELIDFNATVKTCDEVPEDEAAVLKLNYSKKECRNILESFVKKTIPEKFAATKASASSKSYQLYYDYNTKKSQFGGYSFAYTRYNENVPFYGNNIHGAVDAVTGKVYSFSYNWNDGKLPSTKGVIGESEAFDSYIGYDGFDLVYELINNYKDSKSAYGNEVETKARLVYRTAIGPAYIDAFSGKGLNYSGSEYIEMLPGYSYTDIKGHKYERVIELLADMGVGFEEAEFRPDDAITEKEFIEFLDGANGGYVSVRTVGGLTEYVSNGNAVSGDESQAKAKSSKLTRQNLAAIIIGNSGMGEIAKLDIFKTGFDDEAEIDPANIGAVALLKGLNIIGAKSGNSFKPNAKVTRGEAAQIIFNLLTVEENF